jgi:hypothetical protein
MIRQLERLPSDSNLTNETARTAVVSPISRNSGAGPAGRERPGKRCLTRPFLYSNNNSIHF